MSIKFVFYQIIACTNDTFVLYHLADGISITSGSACLNLDIFSLAACLHT